MPTTRPRYQVTETDELARALDRAAERWPHEPRSRLLLRLVSAGEKALAGDDDVALRRAAVEATSGAYTGVYGVDYLDGLRADWPE